MDGEEDRLQDLSTENRINASKQPLGILKTFQRAGMTRYNSLKIEHSEPYVTKQKNMSRFGEYVLYMWSLDRDHS